jgi:hypothetical protein
MSARGRRCGRRMHDHHDLAMRVGVERREKKVCKIMGRLN